jgi:uncharacterized membrane protein
MKKIINKLKSNWPLSLIILEFIITVVLYPILPNEIAVHWNSASADGFLPKYIGAFVIPVVTFIPYFLLKKYDISMIAARFRLYAVIALLLGCQVFILCYALSLK